MFCVAAFFLIVLFVEVVVLAGFSSNRRRRPRSDISSRLRQRVLLRAGGRCQLRLAGCVGVATQVDHVTPWYLGGEPVEDNLQAVCDACHAVKTQGEAQAARRSLAARREKPLALGVQLFSGGGTAAPVLPEGGGGVPPRSGFAAREA